MDDETRKGFLESLWGESFNGNEKELSINQKLDKIIILLEEKKNGEG